MNCPHQRRITLPEIRGRLVASATGFPESKVPSLTTPLSFLEMARFRPEKGNFKAI